LAVLFGSTFRLYVRAVYSCRTFWLFFVYIFSDRIFKGRILQLDIKAVLFGSTFKPHIKAGYIKPCFLAVFLGRIFWPYFLALNLGFILGPYIHAVLFVCIFIHIFSGRLFIGPILRLDFKAVLFGCTFKPYIKAGFLSRDY
jgi:hypothetical protein